MINGNGGDYPLNHDAAKKSRLLFLKGDHFVVDDPYFKLNEGSTMGSLLADLGTTEIEAELQPDRISIFVL